MAPRCSPISPPACESAPLGIPGEPLPPQDDLVEISRQVLAHVPAGPGEWLLIRDPYLMVLECGIGGRCDLSYWIAIPQLWGRNRDAAESRLPTLPYCAYAPCSQPLPASNDEMLGLARSILDGPPPARDGKSLLIKDPYIMVAENRGDDRTILFWTTVAELYARSISRYQLHPQPPLTIPASLWVDRP